MCIEPSTLSAGPVSATVTALAANGRKIASALAVEISATVPAPRRYGLALYLVSRFLEHTDALTTVGHVRPVESAGGVTYYFN